MKQLEVSLTVRIRHIIDVPDEVLLDRERLEDFISDNIPLPFTSYEVDEESYRLLDGSPLPE